MRFMHATQLVPVDAFTCHCNGEPGHWANLNTPAFRSTVPTRALQPNDDVRRGTAARDTIFSIRRCPCLGTALIADAQVAVPPGRLVEFQTMVHVTTFS